jgi:GNAT superfamily N-acetyltransferase
MSVMIARSDEDIAACFEVMHELRPHLGQHEFVARVREQQQEGYHLAFIRDESGTVAAAGVRVIQNMAWGRFLYVDDLVTLDRARSRGYGARLLAWLHEHARELDCDELHLDSGTWREGAHRFYKREGMELTSYHFASKLR